MAEDKKSFVLYSDYEELFDELTDEEAGQLIKHVLKYVNDKNPVTDNKIVKVSFVPIKRQLKRDLEKYEDKRKQWSEAGKKSAELRKQKALEENQRPSTTLKSVATDSTVNVNDNVNVNVNDTVIKQKQKVFSFRKELLNLNIEEYIINDWLKVRKLKKAVNTQIAFEAIKIQIEKSGISANDCIKKAVENSWSGFRASWINKQQPQIPTSQRRESDY